MERIVDPINITQINIEKYGEGVFSSENPITSSATIDKDMVMLSTKQGILLYNITTRSVDRYFSEGPVLYKIHLIPEYSLMVALKLSRIVFYIYQPQAQTLNQFLTPMVRLTTNAIQYHTITMTCLKKSIVIAGVDKDTKCELTVGQYSFNGNVLQKITLMNSNESIVDICFINICLCVITPNELKVIPCLRKGRVLSKSIKLNELPSFTRISPAQILVKINSELFSLTDTSIVPIESTAPINGVLLLPPLILLFHELNPHRFFMSYIINNNNKPSQMVRRPEFTHITNIISPLIFCLPCNRLCIVSLKTEYYKQLLIEGRLEEGLLMNKRGTEEDRKWDISGCVLRVYELLSQIYQNYKIEKVIRSESLEEILKLLNRTKMNILSNSIIIEYIIRDFCPSLFHSLHSLFQLGTNDISMKIMEQFPEQLYHRLNDLMRMFLELRASMIKKKLIPTLAIPPRHAFLPLYQAHFDSDDKTSATACVLIQLYIFSNTITPSIKQYINKHKNIDNSIIELALKPYESCLLDFLTLMDDVPRIMGLKLSDPLLRLDALVSIAKNRQWNGEINDPLAIAFQEIVITSFKRLLYSPIIDGSKELQIILFRIFGGKDSYLPPKVVLSLLEAWEVSKNSMVNNEASKRMKILYLTGLLDQYQNEKAPDWLVNWCFVEYVQYTHSMASLGVKVPLNLLNKCICLIEEYPQIASQLEKITNVLSWECYPISCPIAFSVSQEKGIDHFISVIRKFYSNGQDTTLGETGMILRVEDDLFNFITTLNDRFGNTVGVSNRSTLLNQFKFYLPQLKNVYQPFLTPSIGTVELELILYLQLQKNTKLIHYTIIKLLDSYNAIPLGCVETFLQTVQPEQLPIECFKLFLHRKCSNDLQYYKQFLAFMIYYIEQIPNNTDIIIDYYLEYTGLPGEDDINAKEKLINILNDSPYYQKKLKQMENINWRIRARLIYLNSKYKGLLEYLKVFIEEYKKNKNYFELFENDLTLFFDKDYCEDEVRSIRKSFKPFCEEKKCVLTETIYYCISMAPDGVTSPLLGVLMKELDLMQAPIKYNVLIFNLFYKQIPPYISTEHDQWLGIKSPKISSRIHFNIYTYLIDSLPSNILIPLLQKSVPCAATEYFSLRFKEMGLRTYQPILSTRFETQTINTKCGVCERAIKSGDKFIVKNGVFYHIQCK
ncbi:hypothetical protein EHI8A_087990 [Entamoeba histolytica HM-1:IMSS-B]|uniref:Uncharacterized protein n=6 Tax=Entamoeba histolytica TaxID=5759 RepID=C4M1F9_ENTH1|nr:hypothetical protein EHI_192280 [Entamoeba histolytica HM-1:IMSS]EMD44515.1 Hypothetical protein EHI5A_035720 [Entamoeba histolytica KU27]EMH78217.1 hypothetical protein EHI8A_087990 [Entamoeba histolytica HM-1:IMSS-B]EMS13794.1 hypothetical protein KM1_156530 [Entamoeba histolytica HM-3:IMSS]ENY60007.1 hypothetical protein EHI7A_085220 [Entamoeba histolytica HM-1:IMSS-A]GAT95043.1 hypothetical protein CL6EHI_192280 [Entamoeba histolytica]|eukprot:XP_648468.1 hypothetical protein EHI_192280 [Entamoeba histolytica HM-1:IMSS]